MERKEREELRDLRIMIKILREDITELNKRIRKLEIENKYLKEKLENG